MGLVSKKRDIGECVAGYGVDMEGMQVATVYERGRPADILLIEDNSGDSMLIELAFRKADLPVQVTIAETAEAGLNLLQFKDENTRRRYPDIVFLDLNLPCMHGLTFLELVKSNPPLSSIPVVVLSSSSAPKDIAASYSRHANGFVTKPGSMEGYLAFARSINDYWFRLVQTPLSPNVAGDPFRPHIRG